jgi:hypothetical protein
MMPLEDSRDEVEHQLAALVIRSRLHGESNRLPATTIDGATHAPLAVTIDGSLDGMIEVHRRIEQIWPIKLVTRMALTRRGDGLWHEDLIVDVVYGP